MKDSRGRTGSARRRTRPAVIAIFVLSQLIAFFVIVEIGARIFDPLGISYFPETARLLDQMIIEEPIGYRLPPGLHGRFHGVDVQTNEYGMRDRPVPKQKAPGEYRILVMGDSVMFSIGVEYEDSIPYQIERLANEHAPPGRHYRTLNMGVPSYNTEQEYYQLEEVGLSLQPDAAILLLVANDLESKMWVFEKRSSRLADFTQRSYAGSLVFALLRPRAKRLIEMLVPEVDSPQEYAATGGKTVDARFREIESTLGKINRRLRDVGSGLLVVCYSNVDDRLVAIIRAAGAREGYAVSRLDVFADPRWSHHEKSEFENSAIDSHCNPEGCVIHATMLYELLSQAGLL